MKKVIIIDKYLDEKGDPLEFDCPHIHKDIVKNSIILIEPIEGENLFIKFKKKYYNFRDVDVPKEVYQCKLIKVI